MIFRRKTPEVDLTNEAYSRWLLAGRPQPVTWFLGLEPEAQGTLADIGKEYTEDVCIGIGYAVADPVAAEAGLDADTNPESEAALVQRLAAGMLDRAPNRPPAAPEPEPPLSMGGLTERREARVQASENGNTKDRVLFGRKPDEVAT